MSDETPVEPVPCSVCGHVHKTVGSGLCMVRVEGERKPCLCRGVTDAAE